MSATVLTLLAEARDRVEPLDARLLLAHCLHLDPARLYARPETQVGDSAAARYRALLEQCSSGTPLAYLTGRHGFWNLELEVSPATLVPRPETELLVETALDLLPSTPALVADLGTGSGAIALALAWERPRWHLFATDIAADTLAVATRNLERTRQRAAAQRRPLARVDLQRGDWCAALPADLRLDAIVSNPPYIASNDPHLPALAAEPRRALVSGADGLDAIGSIVNDAPGHLRPGGWLLLEHGHDQGGLVRSVLIGQGFTAVQTLQDLAGHDRVSCGQWPA